MTNARGNPRRQQSRAVSTLASQFADMVRYASPDLIADGPDIRQLEPGWIGQVPVEVALIRVEGQASPQPMVITMSAACAWPLFSRLRPDGCGVQGQPRYVLASDTAKIVCHHDGWLPASAAWPLPARPYVPDRHSRSLILR
jgi:hypothetical protein